MGPGFRRDDEVVGPSAIAALKKKQRRHRATLLAWPPEMGAQTSFAHPASNRARFDAS